VDDATDGDGHVDGNTLVECMCVVGVLLFVCVTCEQKA
jgi:hypothetical protein